LVALAINGRENNALNPLLASSLHNLMAVTIERLVVYV
jgi:hypothetical protein